MADQSPEEIHLKHIRASDYKEIAADGTLHKIVDNHWSSPSTSKIRG